LPGILADVAARVHTPGLRADNAVEMDRWIRWTTKTGTSLWHRATPVNTVVRIWGRVDPGSAVEEVGFVEAPPGLIGAAITYRRTACGFVVPPHERIEEWMGMPPLPRCIWCVHGWVVDTAPPRGAPPAQGGSRTRSIVIRTRGKKPPTQHA